MKIKGLVNNVVGEFDAEPVEIVNDDNEPITFENKAELEQFIADYIVDFLTEGESNG